MGNGRFFAGFVHALTRCLFSPQKEGKEVFAEVFTVSSAPQRETFFLEYKSVPLCSFPVRRIFTEGGVPCAFVVQSLTLYLFSTLSLSLCFYEGSYFFPGYYP